MKCEICKKNEAAMFIQHIMNNNTEEVHLCKQCAERYNLWSNNTKISDELKHVLRNLIIQKQHNTDAPDINTQRICPECGTSFAHIKKHSQIGCPSCFFYFQTEILDAIKKRQSSPVYHEPLAQNAHVLSDTKISLVHLKEKLATAVVEEDYELAAYFRDKIKELEACS